MNLRYKIADCETAGFAGPNETGSGVVEIGWLEIDAELNILDERSSLIQPGRPIEDGAFEAHGISDADVFGKPTLEKFYLNNWNDAPTAVIAHNASFDMRFLAHAIPHIASTTCTLALARQYLPDAPNHKLVTLAEHYGLEKGPAHRALGDCITTRSLLRLIMDKTGRNLPDLVKLAQKPKMLTSMPFGKYKGRAFHDLPTDYLDWILSAADMPPDVVISAQTARKLK